MAHSSSSEENASSGGKAISKKEMHFQPVPVKENKKEDKNHALI